MLVKHILSNVFCFRLSISSHRIISICFNFVRIHPLGQINGLVYYWVMFTVLTGIWETFFVINNHNVENLAGNLLVNQTHVWTQNYSSINLNPSNFSQLFYAEYGAYADREYMNSRDDWSRVIESSHSILCEL